MHLSGQLTDWSINDLLQIMQVTQKTGSLDIDGERRGRVHFRDGLVTGAELSGAKGAENAVDRGAVADVIYVLGALEQGRFSVGPADGPETDGWGVEDVMTDVDALRAVEKEVVEAGLIEADSVRFVPTIDDPLTIEPEDWAIVSSLVQSFSFSNLEVTLGRGPAVRLFHTLHRLGVAESRTEEPDESEWLDRLADGISPPDTETPMWSDPVSEGEVVEEAFDTDPLLEVDPEREPEPKPDPEVIVADHDPEDLRGVSAPASTTLTDGVYNEIRRLRSKVAEK
jgi:hypothetical protein